jgi:long-chain acyl-CoA synthetase
MLNNQEFFYEIMKPKSDASEHIAVKQVGGASYTYKDLEELVNRMHSAFVKAGMRNGQIIGIIISNPLDFLVCFLAIIQSGGVSLPIYDKTGAERIKKLIDFFDVQYIITAEKLDLSNMDSVDIEDRNYFIYSLEERGNDITEHVVLLMMTSGTTALPKGVKLTADNLMSNISSISDYLKLNDSDKILIVKNINHISTIVGEILVSLYNGCTVIFQANIFHVSYITKIFDQEGISVFFTVPMLLDSFICKNVVYRGIRIINFYGAKMSKHKITRLFECFPNTNLIYSYGLTEASPRVSYIEGKDMVNRIGSSGRAVKGVRFSIQNENGIELDPFKEGEIVVEGPNIMAGYYRNQKLTSETVKDGKLYTGDLGYIDEDDFLFVTGRKDNMINIAGKNVHPEEVEEVLLSYPAIIDALVKLSDTGKFVSLIAYIVSADEVDRISLLAYCRERIEDYKIPRDIRQVDQIEKTLSGKSIRSRNNE